MSGQFLRAATVSALLLLGGCWGGFPTDEAMVETFRTRRADFDRLLEKIDDDPHLRRVAHDWCEDADGGRHFGPTPGTLGVEGWGAYRELFYALDLGDGFEVRDGVVYLLASARGGGDARAVKGYAFGGGASLPACEPEAAPTTRGCFRPIADGWYLFERAGG